MVIVRKSCAARVGRAFLLAGCPSRMGEPVPRPCHGPLRQGGSLLAHLARTLLSGLCPEYENYLYFPASPFPIAFSASGAMIAYPAAFGCNPSSANSFFMNPLASTSALK